MNRRSIRVLLALLVLPLGCGKMHDPVLAAKLDGILNRCAQSGTICAARVVEVSSGREVYATNAHRAMMPASCLKLLTSAALLDRFGPDHTFKTYLAMKGDDLWVIGTGDPGTGDPRIASWSKKAPVSMFDDWADALAKHGITRISGKLYYYDGALEATWVHPSWDSDFLVEWFAAPVSGLNFNDNCLDITVKPAADGRKIEYDLMPPVKNVQVINNCLAGPSQSPRIVRAGWGDVFIVSGTAKESATLQSKPVCDPGAFFADAMRTHFESRGIVIEGATVRASAPPASTTILATHETRLRDVIWRINKNSQNFFAEAACKLLGQKDEADRGRSIAGSWESGSRAIHAFLAKSHIDDSQVVIADGSGLSRDNRVTAKALTDLLLVMQQHRSGEVFRESLSVAGKDGSLAKRLASLNGRVLGKTGFIGGVCSLAGYVRSGGGQWLCFAILYNGNFDADEKPYQGLQDDALTALSEWQ